MNHNSKNMGTLYSRSIGVLFAKGEYILTLDNDDMFFDEDVFNFIHNIGKESNYDIIGFKSILMKNYSDNINKMKDNPFSSHANNLILYQPDLGRHPFLQNGSYNDINIWGKYIKTKIYKKSINILGKKRISNFICWAEDTIIVFIIFNIAKSYKFVEKYGVVHLCSKSTASNTQPKNNIIFAEIFFLDIFLEFSKDDNYKNFAAFYALKIYKKYHINNFGDSKLLLYFKSIIKKIMKNQYISKVNKEIIKRIFIF